MSLTLQQKKLFEEQGYLGPITLFSAEEAQAWARDFTPRINSFPALEPGSKPRPDADFRLSALEKFKSVLAKLTGRGSPQGHPAHWYKSAHILVPEMAVLGKRAAFVEIATDLLGPDVLLWGAQLVEKAPGQPHRWHADVEHLAWEGFSIWLALNNVSQNSTIKFVPGSHRFDFIPQDMHGVDLKNDDAVLAALRARHLDAEIKSLAIAPGQFILFAGRSWHATINGSAQTRQALIFQYCRPDARVRVPLTFDNPVSWSPDQPWVMQAAGKDRFGVNFIRP